MIYKEVALTPRGVENSSGRALRWMYLRSVDQHGSCFDAQIPIPIHHRKTTCILRNEAALAFVHSRFSSGGGLLRNYLGEARGGQASFYRG
jgi:hypothetical protein